MTMDGKPRSKESLGQRLGHEMIKLGVITAYLYVCFGAVLLYKAAILHAEGIRYELFGIAIVKALILAKFILLGQAARLGDRYSERRLIHVIWQKSLLYLLLLLVLSELEEILVGVLHGRTFDAVLTEMGGSMLWQTLAASLIMLLVLIPYIAVGEFSAALGEGKLRQLLVTRQTGPAARGRVQTSAE